jgi:uncharacterized repeat protein (TIGR03833 family)
MREKVPMRADIRPGLRVEIVLKQDQRSVQRTEGVVKEILTKSPTHPHGIKVRLEGGAVGRVKAILLAVGISSILLISSAFYLLNNI